MDKDQFLEKIKSLPGVTVKPCPIGKCDEVSCLDYSIYLTPDGRIYGEYGGSSSKDTYIYVPFEDFEKFPRDIYSRFNDNPITAKFSEWKTEDVESLIGIFTFLSNYRTNHLKPCRANHHQLVYKWDASDSCIFENEKSIPGIDIDVVSELTAFELNNNLIELLDCVHEGCFGVEELSLCDIDEYIDDESILESLEQYLDELDSKGESYTLYKMDCD